MAKGCIVASEVFLICTTQLYQFLVPFFCFYHVVTSLKYSFLNTPNTSCWSLPEGSKYTSFSPLIHMSLISRSYCYACTLTVSWNSHKAVINFLFSGLISQGFFRRCLLKKKDTMRCAKGSKCTIQPGKRNLCVLCRYKKCLEAGMSVEGL